MMSIRNREEFHQLLVIRIIEIRLVFEKIENY